MDVQYKFVISQAKDWHEIENEWLGLVPKDKVVLMPAGDSRSELEKVRQTVAQIATDNHVHYCDRLHIVLWNQKTGV
jgi:organic radical activating enzyme